MTLSYWEKDAWFTDVDFCVVGSGIVGLSCALQLKKDYPLAKILVLERGVLPNGASTKNAGFACFGSVSEILSDLKSHSESEVFNLVKLRYQGLQLLRENLGDDAIGFRNYGGYEVFLKKDPILFEKCLSHLKYVNEFLEPIFEKNVFKVSQDRFNFRNSFNELILNSFEGQVNVGKMMQNLLQKVQSLGVIILNNIEVKAIENSAEKVILRLRDMEFQAKHVFVATNAFSRQLIDVEIEAARNQVLITEPIKNLSLKGTFHLEEGYFYFRNVGSRILLGGGRHLNKKGETTDKFSTTSEIQNALEDLLKDTILSKHKFEIEQRWSGILGIGQKKKPILKSYNERVHCAVRLGGMGVALGSLLGQKLANVIKN